MNTALFEQAWAAVCFGKVNWWWSEQLCLFTVGTWTLFLAVEGTRVLNALTHSLTRIFEGKRQSVRHVWAYMLLGQVVAISVASNLFYLALIISTSHPPNSTKRRRSPLFAPPALWMSILISHCAVIASPFTSDRTFLPNLLVMHALLIIPLLLSTPTETNTRPSMSIRSLYLTAALLSLGTRARTTLSLESLLNPTSFIQLAWSTLHSHPAQASIGWDVIYTTVSFVAWIACTSPKGIPFATLSTIPLVSAGPTASYILARKEIGDLPLEMKAR